MHSCRQAFVDSSLVFIARPRRIWVSHRDCVWSADRPLKQVMRLKSLYNDCRILFRQYLGVKVADVRHVVDELCSLANETCAKPTSRFEELFTLLDQSSSHGAKITDEQVTKIRAAPCFPLIVAGQTSREAADIELRSVEDGDWYIPDKTPLQAVFYPKVDLLSLSVKQVQSLAGLFERLKCRDMFLSSAVEESVKPSGERIKDILTESDLHTRLRYISQ